MTGNQSKTVQEYDRNLRSTPSKVNSLDRNLRSTPSKVRSLAKANNFVITSAKREPRNTPVKTTPTSKFNLKNEQKLNEKELSSCLDFNEISDNSNSSDDENEESRKFKPPLMKLITKKEIAQWRVSDSPIIKSSSPSRRNKSPCEKLQSPCTRIKNMSPGKSEQLNKARRSLNLELCTNSEKNKKSPLKMTLKRKFVDLEDNKDISSAKTVCTKTLNSEDNIDISDVSVICIKTSPVLKDPDMLETPPLLKRKLRARGDIKFPMWRRKDESSPLKEIQSPKTNSPQTIKCWTPQKSTSKISATTPKSNNKLSFGTPVRYMGMKTCGTPVSRKLEGRGFLTPTMAEKQKSNQISTPQGLLDQARVQLHISTIPISLPCREKEFKNIHGFLKRKINDHAGGCMYISGVPGTGKTVTVHAVVRSLQQSADDDELSPFDFVEVNGLRLTDPRQAYVRILQTLTEQKLTAEQAQRILDKRFSGSTKRSTVLLMDELDYLCNRRQDVVYNILDWTSKRNSGLVVLTISNTMDLPERTLKGRVTSRMGLTRLMFQPYTHHQLQEIVLNRLAGNKSFHPDAVQLVARKVAAVSGDARRALDICRRSTELISGKNTVTVSHVESALTQIFTGPRVLAIRSCSKMDQLVLRALRDETQRTGVDESNVRQVYYHLVNICSLEDCQSPNVGDVLRTCTALAATGLIVAEKGRPDIMRKLSLNVSSDDIHYALDC